MGRRVAENHRVMEQNDQGVAEELIKQQNVSEDFVLGENEEDMHQKEAQAERNMGSDIVEQEEPQRENVFGETVILTGAATYLDSGIRYFKNKPVKVTDQRVYEQLLKTGLFVHL